MLLDWIIWIVAAKGVVASAILLSCLLYVAKFGYYRKFDQIDIIVGLSELPSVISATCASLIVAAFTLNSEDKLLAFYLLITLLILLANFVLFRLIEYRKLTLNEHPFQNFFIITGSYALILCISLAAASRAYDGVTA